VATPRCSTTARMVEPAFAQIKNNLRAERFYERRGRISDGHWTFYPELGVADTRFRLSLSEGAVESGAAGTWRERGAELAVTARPESRQTNGRSARRQLAGPSPRRRSIALHGKHYCAPGRFVFALSGESSVAVRRRNQATALVLGTQLTQPRRALSRIAPSRARAPFPHARRGGTRRCRSPRRR
jgi:hypothetical protein